MSTARTAKQPHPLHRTPVRRVGLYALRSLIDAHIGKTYLLVTTD